METLSDIVKNHINNYPLITAVDLLKLIYQNVFGPGHLINDIEKSYNFLETELSTLQSFEQDYIEHIGGGYCRLNLQIIKDEYLSIDTLHRLFLLSAKERAVDLTRFENKVSECKDFLINNNYQDLAQELQGSINEQDSLTPFSHSQQYKQAYSPAYRVVKKEYCEFLPLLSKIDEAVRNNNSYIVAIDGHCGGGKTTLALLLKEIYSCELISMDHFFLRPHQRTKERLQEVGGNIDYDRFNNEVTCNINKGNEFSYQEYQCSAGDFVGNIKISDNKLKVVVGTYSMHPKFGNIYNTKVFITVSNEEQLRRIKIRNGTDMLKVFKETYIPMENEYFKTFLIKEQSDFVFDTTFSR